MAVISGVCAPARRGCRSVVVVAAIVGLISCSSSVESTAVVVGLVASSLTAAVAVAVASVASVHLALSSGSESPAS